MIIPLPKTGDLSRVTNWRPISVINMIGKVLEKVVHTEIMGIFRRLETISKKQFGFMAGRSTMQAVYCLVQDLYEARNRAHVAAVVFLDLRKAFDTVDHGRLLEKLKNLGCSLSALTWFKSYLENRTQCTKANEQVSGDEKVVCGVPQGSVLGPLLFVLYINDITNCLTNSKFYLYADDLALMVEHQKAEGVKTLLQEDLDIVCHWCDTNRLTVNQEKTKVMWCYSPWSIPDVSDCGLTLKGATLKVVKEFSYLGVTLDYKLSFVPQANKVKSLVYIRLAQLRQVRKVSDQKTDLTSI